MRSSAQFGAENFICSIEFIEKRILWATKKHTFVWISRRKHCYYHTYLWHLDRCMEDMAVELLYWQEWVANIDMNPMYNCKKYLKIWKQKNHQLIIWVGVISIFEAKQNKIQKNEYVHYTFKASYHVFYLLAFSIYDRETPQLVYAHNNVKSISERERKMSINKLHPHMAHPLRTHVHLSMCQNE